MRTEQIGEMPNTEKCRAAVHTLVVITILSFHCAPMAAEEPACLRVLTYNIHAGRGSDGELDLQRIATSINQTKPDLVALQEVDRRTRRSDGRDLLAELAVLTDMHYAFGKAINFQDGEYGVGILSKPKLVGTKVIPLPTTKGREPRVALEVVVKSNRLPKFVFVCTHFDHTSDETDRVAQANRIFDLFSKGPNPAIIAGDLNATPNSKPISVLTKHWQLATGR